MSDSGEMGGRGAEEVTSLSEGSERVLEDIAYRRFWISFMSESMSD